MLYFQFFNTYDSYYRNYCSKILFILTETCILLFFEKIKKEDLEPNNNNLHQ